jgi:predicted metalloprotease
MRLDNQRPSENIEDRRGAGGGFGFPRGGGYRIPIGTGGGRGMSISTILILIVIYFIAKAVFGIDLLDMLSGGSGVDQSRNLQPPSESRSANVTGDAGRDFVARVLGSTEDVWSGIFQTAGRRYDPPTLVLFTGAVQSACGMAQSAMGPFYCPQDRKVYIDLSFYQDMRDRLGAPGDFAQAYVVAHEVGHHVQNLLGLAEKVEQARTQSSEVESNALSVRMELQADCYAGVWANHARQLLEEGDVDEALNAAAQIGDDRLQRRSQGYVVPESFTHGTSEQRQRWFKTGMNSGDMQSCDTFNAARL